MIGFAVCALLIPPIQRWSRSLSTNSDRSFHHTHKAPVSRFGGIALAAAFAVIAVLATTLCGETARTPIIVVIGCLAMFALGLADDLRPLGAKIKLIAQVATAIAIYFAGLQIEVLNNPLSGKPIALGLWSLPVTVFWIVALTNLINLIDGMDGLAGGISLMLMCLLAYTGLAHGSYSFATCMSIGMAAALIAFLCYNFPPATIYMGDGGAYFLGAFIALVTISTSHKGTIAAGLIAPLVALGLPIIDVSLAILRRGFSGLPIFRPDRKHIHHRLIQSGFSRRRAVLILYGISLMCVAAAFGIFWLQGKLVPILFGVACLVVLCAAPIVSFAQNFWQVRRVLGTSLQLRRESRYALAMMAWLEIEAERCDTLQELWTSYLFFTRKMGFFHLRLVLEAGTDFVWRSLVAAESDAEWHRVRQDLAFANIRAIEFSARTSAMSAETFQHLAELAAEAWMKAAQRWKAARGHNVIFTPALPQIAPILDPGHVMVANAA
jgi:UDP-GlcNAc:undecaprenyl-phosphate GlcNAc-1-phosphate transferase